MTDDQVEGAANNVVGKVQDAAGGLLGDTGLQLQGKAKQFAGAVQSKYGDGVDQVIETTRDNPVGALLVAVGVGFLLGKFL